MEIMQFLRSVFSGWVETVGIVLTVLPFIERIPRVKEWLQDKPLLDRFAPLLWVIGISCIVWGFYAAWEEQREIARTIQQKLDDTTKPKFAFTLGQAAFNFQPSENTTALLLQADILNRGAASVTRNWKAHYDSPTLNTDIVFARPVKEPIMFGEPGQPGAVAFYGSKAILNTTAINPIERGAASSGRILLAIPGNKLNEISKGDALVTVTMEDYWGQSYSAQFRGGRGGNPRVEFLPGEMPAPNLGKRKRQ